MGAYNLGNAGDISSIDDFPKIRAYLYRLNEQLRYMFDNLSPEDNYNDKALLQYVADGERQSAIEVSLDQISLSMVDKDNVVAAINMSKEQIQIQADKIKMEGLVTVNSYFKIGLDGSIEARNGKFSGHISASTMDSSQITLGGNGKDGKVLVYDSQGIEIGRWDKYGINVQLGAVSGTTINVGGSGTPGSINIYNQSGNLIGSWTRDGIDVKQGAITGTAITVGGNGNTGTLTVKDGNGITIGTWDYAGINVLKGVITGTAITLGGSGSTGRMTVHDALGNTIGSWNAAGISVLKGTITGTTIRLYRGSDIGFLADGNVIALGDFEVHDGWGRQVIESSDSRTGMSGEPDGNGYMYLWAGYKGSYNRTAFYVDNTTDIGYGNTVVNGGLFVNGAILLNNTNLWTYLQGLEDRIEALEHSQPDDE